MFKVLGRPNGSSILECTKYGGKGKCDEKYIREEGLVGSIAKLVDQFKTKQLKIHSKVTREVQKFNEMQRQTMGNEAKEIDTQGYIQYILRNGTHLEKEGFFNA